MKEAVIFKTGAAIANPVLGIDKMIVNFPGGLSTEFPDEHAVTVAQTGLFMSRKVEDDLFKIKVYNGHLMSKGNAYEWIEARWLISTTTDSFGNTVRYYELDKTFEVGRELLEQGFHFTLGTTRVEVLDLSKMATCWYGGIGRSYLLSEGEVNIEGFAINGFPKVQVKNCPAFGDLKVFKDCDFITDLFINSTNVTGDIANLAKSAAKPGAFISTSNPSYSAMQCGYCTDIYGEITPILEAMKNRTDVRGQTYDWYFYQTQVTYKGNLINGAGARKVAFDAQGNYTVDGQ